MHICIPRKIRSLMLCYAIHCYANAITATDHYINQAINNQTNQALIKVTKFLCVISLFVIFLLETSWKGLSGIYSILYRKLFIRNLGPQCFLKIDDWQMRKSDIQSSLYSKEIFYAYLTFVRLLITVPLVIEKFSCRVNFILEKHALHRPCLSKWAMNQYN